MVENLKMPNNDFLSWTMYGTEWINFEYLTQLIYYFLFVNGKMFALFGLKILIFIGILFVFLKILKLYKANSISYLVLPVLSAGLLPSTDLRPENFTLLFFAIELYWLEKLRISSFPEKKNAIRTSSFLFFVLWTNLHAGYVYGIALIFFYFLGEIFQESLPWIYGREKTIRLSKSIEFLKCLILCFAASLINPHGWKIYKVLWEHQKYLGVLQEHILEWKPFDLTNAYQWPFIIILLASFAFILFAFIKKRNVPFPHIISFLYFAVSSSSHSRHSPFLVLSAITFTLCLLAFKDTSEDKPSEQASIFSKRVFETEKKFTPLKISKFWILAQMIFFACLICYFKIFILPQYSQRPAEIAQSSKSLIMFLKDNSRELKNLKMFNYWGWGGFLGFYLGPDYKIFMDGRYIFHHFLEETQKVGRNLKLWNNFLNKYGIELVIVEREDTKIIIKQKQPDGSNKLIWKPAYMFYLPKKEWALVYWDKKIIVFVKRNQISKIWLAKNEFKLLKPEDTVNLAISAIEGKTNLKEIQKEVSLYLSNNWAFSESGAGDKILEWWRTLRKVYRNKNPIFPENR